MLQRPDGRSASDADPHSFPAHQRPAISDSELRIDEPTISLLRCPQCAGDLRQASQSFQCDGCGADYPISGGAPVLIAESKSLFDIATFTNRDATFFRPVGRLRAWISRWLPDVSLNLSANRVLGEMSQQLTARVAEPTVLVIGGGVIGGGMQRLVDDPRIQLIETDAAVAPRTKLICDAHDLPFADRSMDGVIVQAVLEHVVDPPRCVAEIHRVLKPGGLVYADTPFIQQVHGRQYDFTRFTRLGHRRLFRMFKEIQSGVSCGPGVALAWSLRYFLLSFFGDQRCRAAVSLLARLAFFPLKYCDRFLAGKPSANDAASAFYFLGSRSEQPLGDRELVDSYRGGF